MQSRFQPCPSPLARHRFDPRRMAGGLEEPHKPLAGNRGGIGIHQRVKVQDRVRHQAGIEDHRHAAVPVVNDGERGHRAGLDAERLAHRFGRPERKPPGRANKPVQRFELDHGIFFGHDQEQRALLVAQEQVLAVPARRIFGAQRAGLLDRKGRRMPHRAVGNAEAVEKGEQFVGRGGHRRAS